MRMKVGVALVATAVALGACGGDDDGGNEGDNKGGGNEGLSKQELNKQAAVICKRGAEQSLAVPGGPNLGDPEEAVTWLTGQIEIFGTVLEDLQALEPSEDNKANYDAYLAQIEGNGDALRSIRDKFAARDLGMAGLALDAYGADKGTAAAARKAGLTGCAKG